jgi:hypothetical protein
MKSSTIAPISIGKTSPSAREKDDCSVRALANAADIDYEDAHYCLKEHGRIFGEGVFFETYHRAYLSAGFELFGVYGTTNSAKYIKHKTKVQSKPGLVLSNLLPTIQDGAYIVMVSGHALAVIDGEIIDTERNKANKRVVAVYKNIDY